jgi:hypothetical protein
MIANWLEEIEEQVRAVIEQGGNAPSALELGRRLGVSEESAVSFIGLLASSGRLVIERVSLPRGARGRRDGHGTSALTKAA